MKSKTGKAKRQRLPESERREQILRAALEVARADGLAAVTARNVAQAAGLSQGLVFFHFETTELLLAALVLFLTEHSLTVGPLPADFAGFPGVEQVTAYLSARVEPIDSSGAHPVIDLLVEAWVAGLHAPGTRAKVREATARYRASFVSMAHAAISAEPKRFADVTAEALATLVLCLLTGMAVQAAVDPAAWDPPALRVALKALLGAPRPRKT
jgi:AcrR family transcriptional regulator